jgi:hypothetical protein
MNRCVLLSILMSSISALNLRAFDDGLWAYDEDDQAKPQWKYTPSNRNTQPPKSFDDEVQPDTTYHDMVPAMEVLKDLTSAKNRR